MRKKGARGEAFAIRYLQRKGYAILARNYHIRYAELDIIAKYKQTLVFIEVKAYDKPQFIHPLEVMTKRKLKRMHLAASAYLQDKGITNTDCRLDLIILYRDKVTDHLEGIF